MLVQYSMATVQPIFGQPIYNGHQQISPTPVNPRAMINQLPQPNLMDYFPQLNGDGLLLNWSHAVNSRTLLAEALHGDCHLIEADVSLAENTRYPIPIMAHPPISISDITLEDWLSEIIRSESRKGIKLDFKSTRVVEPAFRVLARHADFINAPLILNADILPGLKSSQTPVDAWTFLMLCRTRFPQAIISIGWTNTNDNSYDEFTLSTGYTRQMVDQMVSLVKEYSLLQPVTFPICASFLKPSIIELQRLLLQVPNSSLTIWGHENQPISMEDLHIYRKNFTPDQIFFDLPHCTLNLFRTQIYCQSV